MKRKILQCPLLWGGLLLALSTLTTGSLLQAQTDVAASVIGSFTQSSTTTSTSQNPANQAGVLLELRHISNPLVGWEVSYSYNRANQTYQTSLVANPAVCSVNPFLCPGYNGNGLLQSVKANAHEVTADWVVSMKVGNIRPFALAGAGLLVFNASGDQTNTSNSTKGAFVYGGGLDWGVLPHLGLRAQYRGNVYKAPDLAKSFSSVDKFTHSAEPAIGAYFRF